MRREGFAAVGFMNNLHVSSAQKYKAQMTAVSAQETHLVIRQTMLMVCTFSQSCFNSFSTSNFIITNYNKKAVCLLQTAYDLNGLQFTSTNHVEAFAPSHG